MSKKWKHQIRVVANRAAIEKWCEASLGPKGVDWDCLHIECSYIFNFDDDETFMFFQLSHNLGKIQKVEEGYSDWDNDDYDEEEYE